MNDTKDWVKKLFPLGIYCFVYDPVTVKGITDKLDNPGVPSNVALEIRTATMETNVMSQIDRAFEKVKEPEQKQRKKNLLGRIIKKPGKPKVVKVILATGAENINKDAANILNDLGCETSECYFREGIDAQEGDVVVLSETLPGQIELADMVKKLRVNDVRVVLLAGNKDNFESLALAKKMISLGAYDVIWNPLTVEKVVERVKKPAKISDIGKEIIVETSELAIEKIVPEDESKSIGFLRGLFKKQHNKNTNGKTINIQNDTLENEEQHEDPCLDDTKEYIPDSSIVNEPKEVESGKIAVEIVDQVITKKHDAEEIPKNNSKELTESFIKQKIDNIPVVFNLSSDVVCVGQGDIPKASRYINKNRDKLMIVLDVNRGLLASEFVKLNHEADWRKAENAKPEMYDHVEFYGIESDLKIPLKNEDINILLRFTEAALDSGRKVFISLDIEDPVSGEIYKKTRGLRLGLRTETRPVVVPVQETKTKPIAVPAKGKKVETITAPAKEIKVKPISLPVQENEANPIAIPVQETVVYKPVDESNFTVFSKALGIVLLVLLSLVLTGVVLYLLHIVFTMIGIKSPFLDEVSKFLRDISISLFG